MSSRSYGSVIPDAFKASAVQTNSQGVARSVCNNIFRYAIATSLPFCRDLTNHHIYGIWWGDITTKSANACTIAMATVYINNQHQYQGKCKTNEPQNGSERSRLWRCPYKWLRLWIHHVGGLLEHQIHHWQFQCPSWRKQLLGLHAERFEYGFLANELQMTKAVMFENDRKRSQLRWSCGWRM